MGKTWVKIWELFIWWLFQGETLNFDLIFLNFLTLPLLVFLTYLAFFLCVLCEIFSFSPENFRVLARIVAFLCEKILFRTLETPILVIFFPLWCDTTRGSFFFKLCNFS